MIMDLTTVARMIPRTAVMLAACASEKTYEAQTQQLHHLGQGVRRHASDRPNDTPRGRRKNRRIEIVRKDPAPEAWGSKGRSGAWVTQMRAGDLCRLAAVAGTDATAPNGG